MNLTDTQKQNAVILRSHLDGQFHIPVQIGIMCVVGKESGFNLKRERSYSGTSNQRLRKLFSRVRNLTDAELTLLKRDNVRFFDRIYGGKLGNRRGTSDGWNYRGWGFNQVTGRTMHLRYGNLGDANNASRACCDFFGSRIGNQRIEKRYGNPSDWDCEHGTMIACNINAGLGYGKNHAVVQRAFKHASEWCDTVRDIYWDHEEKQWKHMA